MPDIFDHIHPEKLAALVGTPEGEVRAAAAGQPAGFRPYWALHALRIAAGHIPHDAPVDHLPPRPGGRLDLSDPWGCLVMAAGGWDRLAVAMGVALPTLKTWKAGLPSGTTRVQSGVLRSLGLRPFFQFDWGTTGSATKYRLAFRRPALTAEEVERGV